MKKSNLIKLFLVLLIGVMIIMFSTNVLAADSTNGFNELTLNTSNSNTNTDNTNTNNVNTNTNTNNSNMSLNTNNLTNNTNSLNVNSNNSSIYNDTNLPKTGLEDSIPMAMLILIFGISAIYAYKKISDYKNI